MAKSELQLQILAVNQASKELQRVARDLKLMGDSATAANRPTQSLFASMSKLAGGVAIGTALGTAFAQAPAALTAMAHAAADDAASVVKLKTAVENSGSSWERVSGAMNKTVDLAMRMGFADEQARDALALLTAQTDSASEAQSRFKLAMDLSRGANIDLFTASKLLGKVTEENVNVLNRYGITIEKGASQAELFAAVQQKFSGQAQAFADSSAGAFARAQVAMGEFSESVGRLVLPAITHAAEGGADLANTLGRLADSSQGIAPIFTSIAASIPAAVAGVAAFGAGFAALRTIQVGATLLEADSIARTVGHSFGIAGAAADEFGPKVTRALRSPQVVIGALAVGFVGLDLAVRKFTGGGLIDYLTGATERMHALNDAAKRYGDSQEKINALVREGLSPDAAKTRELLRQGDALASLEAATARFYQQTLIGNRATAANADQLVRSFGHIGPQYAASLDTIIANIKKAEPTFAELNHLLDLHPEFGGVQKFTDLLKDAAEAAGLAGPAFDNAAHLAGSLQYRKASSDLATVASAFDEASQAARDLGQAFTQVDSLFNQPSADLLGQRAIVASTQALIDHADALGLAVLPEWQIMHDQALKNATALDSFGKAGAASADLVVAKFRLMGANATALADAIASIPEVRRTDVIVQAAGLDKLEQVWTLLSLIKDNPTISTTVALNIARGGAFPELDTGTGRRGSYAQGGIGSFGSGQMAMLHGREAILPLDKPKRTEAILHKLGVKGYADGGFTTGNLPPSLQQQYDRLGTVTGSSGGAASPLTGASRDLLALADAFRIFHEQTGESTDAFTEYLDAQKLVADATTQTIRAQQEVADAQRQGRVELRALADILGKQGITAEAFVAQRGLLALRDAYRQSGLAADQFTDALRGITQELLSTGRKMAREGHEAINSFAVPPGAIPGYGAAGNLTDEGLRKARKTDPRLDKYLTEHPDAVRRYDPIEELRKKLFGTQTQQSKSLVNYGTINVTQQGSTGTDINALSRSLF